MSESQFNNLMNDRMSITFLAPGSGSAAAKLPHENEKQATDKVARSTFAVGVKDRDSTGGTSQTQAPVYVVSQERPSFVAAAMRAAFATRVITQFDTARTIEPVTSYSLSSEPNSGGSARSSKSGSPTMSQRPPRPSYSEEQKFFIMYCRIVRRMNWPEIEDRFAQIFNMRSIGGLTSVYYRIRRSWGMEEVLSNGPDGTESDWRMVNLKAMNFSRDFLASIGYLK